MAQPALIPPAPEAEDPFDEILDEVAAFYMALFAEEMNEGILAVAQLINLRGHIPQLALGADFVEIDRKKFGQLLDQVVYRLNFGVATFGDFLLEEVGVPDAGAAQLQVDDRCRQDGV